MSRYIDADALKKTICENVYPIADVFNSRDYGMFWTGGIEKAIDNQPTADVREVKRGEWKLYDTIMIGEVEVPFYQCSLCDCVISEEMSIYCPRCGAEMDERREDE